MADYADLVRRLRDGRYGFGAMPFDLRDAAAAIEALVARDKAQDATIIRMGQELAKAEAERDALRAELADAKLDVERGIFEVGQLQAQLNALKAMDGDGYA